MPTVPFEVPNNFVTKAMIKSTAGLSGAQIVRHESINIELFGPATTIAALTKWLHLVRGATGTIVAAQVVHAVAGTGDRTVTVDIQKSTGGSAFATMLSGTMQVLVATTIRTAVTATFSSQSVVAGDIVEAIVTLGGTTGSYPQGLLLTVTIEEDYS